MSKVNDFLNEAGLFFLATCDGAYANAMLEENPNLKKIYNEETGHKMMCFWLEDATAVDIAMMGEGEDLLS